MKSEFLGDSYDIVKRFFRDILSPIAPLKADPYFIESSLLSGEYERVTGIALLSNGQTKPIGVLLDPDTGIRAPDHHRDATRSHATTQYIADVLRDSSVAYCIVYDQSYHRNSVRKTDQLTAKLQELENRSVVGFYYVSHAPFLFAARHGRTLAALRKALLNAGIPSGMFFPSQTN